MKRRLNVRPLSLLLVLIMVISLFAGCSGETSEVVESAETAVSSVSEPAEASDTIVPEAEPTMEAAAIEETPEVETVAELPEPGAEFPLVEEGTVDVSVWYATPPFASMMGDYAECDSWYFFDNLSQLTGLDFEFTYSAYDAASENFSLMVAGGDLTDLVSGNRYTNGVDAAIEDEVYLALNDLIEEYCPYYAQQLEREEIRKDAITERGNIGVFYALYDAEGTVNGGTAINASLLEYWDGDSPETYAEYEELLAVLKSNGVEYPVFQSPFHQIIASGYNNIEDWVVIDGQVQYGLVNNDSKEFYTLMAKWYAEGYLIPDYYTTSVFEDQNSVYANITNGSAGVAFAAADAFGMYPEANLTPLHIMVRESGDVVHTYSKDKAITDGNGWVITTDCSEEKQVYLAKTIDYLYTEPGSLMVTWGVEDVSFTYDENGDPSYIDAIFSEYPVGMCAYLKYATMNEVGLSDIRKVNYGLNETELAACAFWDEAQKNDGLYPATSFNEEEQDIYARYYTDAETYIEEYVNRLIYGDESIDSWDSFIATLNSEFHFDEVTAAMQSAYDRYIAK